MSDQDRSHTSPSGTNADQFRSGNGGDSGDLQHTDRRKAVPSLSERLNVRMAALGITPPTPPQSAYREEEMESGPSPEETRLGKKKKTSQSVWGRRWARFKSIRRGYYAFVLLVVLYGLSFFLPLLINNKPLIVHYDGSTYFPAVLDLVDWLPGVGSYYPGTLFGQADQIGEADYRRLAEELESDESGNWIMMPFYKWDPYEYDFKTEGSNPQSPSSLHILGTDPSGRDVFARLAYGFNVSISFALVLAICYYIIGIVVGGLMGYFGGWVDTFGQRIVEIWETIPFLFVVIIISSMVKPGFFVLVWILVAFQWIGISYYIRGEFLREKSRDYVAAAMSLGAGHGSLIFKHLLPNSLTPIVTFFPFALVGGITVLVSLDFLGFGLQPPTPSWGQMMEVGLGNKEHPWLVVTPIAAMFFTLSIVTFIGEAARAAFDPKVFSRLR